MSDLHFESVEKNNTNPKYIGPGTWNVIHTLAYNATTKSSKEAFMKHMSIICKQFPCETCRGHCKEYLKENPMIDYLDVVTEGKPVGLFTWTWQFHNAVNFRIGKPLMTWDMALHIYEQFKNQTDGQCSRDCSDPDHKLPEKDKPAKGGSSMPVKGGKPLFRIEKEKRYYEEHQNKNQKRVRNYNELY